MTVENLKSVIQNSVASVFKSLLLSEDTKTVIAKSMEKVSEDVKKSVDTSSKSARRPPFKVSANTSSSTATHSKKRERDGDSLPSKRITRSKA